MLIDLEAIIVPSLRLQVLHCRADAVAKLEYSHHVVILPVCGFMAERKGQVFVCGASEQEAGAHVTCRLADSNLERNRRLFSNL